MSTKKTRALLLGALLPLAVSLLAQPPPPPRDGGPPPFDRNAPMDLQRLQENELEVQQDILALQEELLIGAKQGKPPKPGDPRLPKLQRLTDKLHVMAGNEARLARRLPPPHLMPPGMPQDLQAQRDKLRAGMGEIQGGFEQLRNKMPEGAGKMPEPPKPEDSTPQPNRPLPTSEQDAGKSINRGEVQSPRSLIETFMQLPDRKVPKSNLNYYRNLRH